MSASFLGAGWAPGPGPGPGGGGGAALAALFSIAARHLIRSKALAKVCSKTTAAALSKDTAALSTAARTRTALTPALALTLAPAARTRPLNTTLQSLAPTLHRTLHSQSAHSTTSPHTALSIQSAALAHTAYRKLTTPTSHKNNRAAAFHTARAFAHPQTRPRLPINQTFQIHGPGLHLARNFSSAGAGAGAGGASTAIQESVPLIFRMIIDDEEKNRRMRKAGRKKPYSIRAAVASSASARPTSQNGARTQVQNALSQHRQRHTLPPSPVSVPASIEEDLSSEECDYFFIPLPTTAAPATVEHQKKADDEQRRRHILRIRSRLLENQGTHAPHQISTVLTLPDEPVDLDWARLLMPPQRPSYDSQTRQRRLKPRTVSAPGGFLNDVNWAAVDLEEEERRRAEEVLEYDRPVRNFVRVLSLLRAVLDVDPHTSAPISNTIRPGSPPTTTTTTTIPSRLIVMEGHAKADVIEGLHLMLDLHAESERLRWKQGELEPTSREVEVVLDVLLRERAVHEQEQELVFRPTVLLGDGGQDDQGFGSPSLQFDFPLAPLS
ncbi:unnamed protein product, partial [Tilletia caries]